MTPRTGVDTGHRPAVLVKYARGDLFLYRVFIQKFLIMILMSVLMSPTIFAVYKFMG